MFAWRMGTRLLLACVAALALVALMGAPSWAAGGTKLCIPTTENTPVKTPLKNGTCASSKTEKFTLTELGTEGKEGPQGKEGKEGPEGKNALSTEELSTLKGVLPCIKSVAKGIDEKPTVQFSGCNVQIVNGAGETRTTNGAGNLVIGYDEGAGTQSGSHNLILGIGQSFTSFGGIDAGNNNDISGEFASVLGGNNNAASGRKSTISGGDENTANGQQSSITGGARNSTGSGVSFAVSISGGVENFAEGSQSWIGAGQNNVVTGSHAAVVGGRGNNAGDANTSIGGGQENVAESSASWIGGGFKNNTFKTGEELGQFAAIFGGKENKTAKEYDAIP